MEIRIAVRLRPVFGVQGVVPGVDDGVVGDLPLRSGVGAGVLLHDGGLAGQLLPSQVLELGDAGVVLIHGIVYRSVALPEVHRVGLKAEVQGAVGQALALPTP